MKRISPNTITMAVLAVLFGLVTAYAVRQYFRGTGLWVTGHTPTQLASGAGSLSTITLTFSKPIDPTSFDATDITLANPRGNAVLLTKLAAVEGSGNTQFKVTFEAQSLGGEYRLTVGPNVLDQSGNSMDQNLNSISGEPTDDSYTGTIELVPQMALVVVPRVNLPPFTRIRAEHVEEAQIPLADFPDGKLPESIVRFPAQVLGRLVKADILASQPIMEQYLYGVDETPRLTNDIKSGYRAVTIEVSITGAINGMVQPGSRVDVNLTVDGQQTQLKGPATLTLLRNVEVLATSDARFPRTTDRPGNVQNVTLAVLSKQANRLILAQRYGTLGVTLRGDEVDSPLGGDDDDNDLIDTYELLGLIPEPEPIILEQTAQIWRGGSMQEVVFDAWDIQEAEDATAAAEGREPVQVAPTMPPNKRQCKACKNKKKPGNGGGVLIPTPAPPRSSPVLPMGSQTQHRPSGQVIYIPVEVGSLNVTSQAGSNGI